MSLNFGSLDICHMSQTSSFKFEIFSQPSLLRCLFLVCDTFGLLFDFAALTDSVLPTIGLSYGYLNKRQLLRFPTDSVLCSSFGVNMSRLKCCVPGCDVVAGSGKLVCILHD